ncbi:MAG: hypothetical protein NXI31_26255 [bacterium]|nr:hypothetical protein [bacterium]
MQRSIAKAGAVCALLMCWPMVGCSGGGDSATYAVRGTVEGLAPNETIVVQLNGGNDLTITADGQFEFAGELPGGMQYTVTVLSGPCDYVTINNGTGTLQSDVSDVSIVCTTWRVPASQQDALSPLGSDADEAYVAINASGDMLVVFVQEDDLDEEQIFVAEFTNGVWTKPMDLTDHISRSGDYSYSPAVALADNGDALIVWSQYDGSDDQVYVAHRRNGTWTYPADEDDNLSVAGRDAYDPQVAMYPTGEAIVVWEQSDGTRNQIFKSEYRSGTWVNPANLTDNISPDAQSAYDPRVAIALNGDAVIAYRQYDGSRYRTMKSELRSSVWAHSTVLADAISPAGQHAEGIDVAMSDNGDSLITWRQSDGSRYQTFKSEYRSATWTHPTGLADNISPDGQHVYSVDVAMAPNGDALIVWHQYDNVGADAVFRSENRNGVWTHPSNLADNLTNDQVDCENPQVAMSNNDAAIVFTRDYGSYDCVYVMDLRSATWRESRRLAPALTDAWEPRVAMNATGRAIVAWPAWTNSGDRVYASYYR